ncbi:acetyl-CoA synthetase-like protein [Thozetella sp. PMI_491]|nr:acetyl-CoA synthetase-like protein [Thozetella sp. PMI_491]
MLSIPLGMPSAADFDTFAASHGVPVSATIRLGYAITLYRFFDLTSYVYLENNAANPPRRRSTTLSHCENTQAGGSDKSRTSPKAYVAKYQPELSHSHAVLSALRAAVPAGDGADPLPILQLLPSPSEDEFRQATNTTLVIECPLNNHHTKASKQDDSRSSLSEDHLSIVVECTETSIQASLSYDPGVHTDFQANNVARAFTKTLEHILANPEDTGEVTFKDLNSIANRFARHLVSKSGLKPTFRVALCFDKSPEAVVAMLAVLKAGGAYCCLDPAHPKSRHEFIIKAVDASAVITSPERHSLFQHTEYPNAVVIDWGCLQQLDGADTNLGVEIEPHDVCLISFTSGSTGVPKGIVHTHTSMCTGIVENAPRQLLDAPETRVFQWAAYTFDVSLTEIYAPLVHGGCMCIPSENERLNDVEGAMNRMRCEWAFFTPSFSRFFRRYNIPTFKTLSMGGEAVTPEDANAWVDRVRVLQAYGPAECITWFVQELGYTDPASRSTSVGRPENIHGWLVDPDDHARLVPIGAVGELLIEGPGLFQEYLHDPEKTEATLIDPPAWRAAVGTPCESKLYKVGDLMRYLPNGEMAYVGRKDAMVKLRGQRIDLGEIETVLRTSLGETADVAADLIIPAGGNGDQALVAFVQLRDKTAPMDTLKAMIPFLQGKLRESLPEYMVPRVFHQIESLPYNASKKLDRKALRQWASALTINELMQTTSDKQSTPKDERRLLLSPSERVFQQLWASALGLPLGAIGLGDNFFALGGSSITAIELIAAARDRGYLVGYTEIFNSHSLAALAEKAVQIEELGVVPDPEPFQLLPETEKNRIIRDAATQCRVAPTDIEDIHPLTPQQEGLWALSLANDGSYVAHFPIRLCKGVDEVKFRAAWHTVTKAFAFMRTRVIQSGTSTYAVVVRKTARWRVATSMETYIAKDLGSRVDFGEPLTRFAYIKDDRPQTNPSLSDNLIVWTTHHTVYDGVSVLLFLNALARAYRGELLEPEVPFTRFLSHTKGSDDSSSREYWLSQYQAGDVATYPKVPYPAYRPHSSGVLSRYVRLDQPKESRITAANVVRAALALTIAQMTESSRVNYLETVSGREISVPGVDSIVNPTFATMPRATRVDSQQTLQDFLSQVQADSAEMTPHAQLGLQTIRQLSPECSAACEFQTILVIEPLYRTEYTDIFEFDDEGGGIQRFNNDIILFKCDMAEEGVKVTVSYDEHVVSEEQANSMGNLFVLAVQFLCDSNRLQLLSTIDWPCHDSKIPAKRSSIIGTDGEKPPVAPQLALAA